MNTFSILANLVTILGCLGVFLFGMKVLSEGIQKAAGERMRQFMATCTRNRFSGLFTGLFTTCLLQSSSATTVIVVGFVNAGLLTLLESIGVIMGANLGTTITAWIIASVGKFNVASIAIPLVGFGIPLIFTKSGRSKAIGEVLIGFGLLFLGLGLLKDSVPDLRAMLKSDSPDDVAIANTITDLVKNLSGKGYLSLLLFLVFGIVLTLVVQSSSAAMAITVTFAMNGWIGFEESAAIVLGENIGTTVTAWLASIGTTANAKRAARAHFLFNVIGVAWMLVVFYGFLHLVTWLTARLPLSLRVGGDQGGDIGFSLAIFHTGFNFLNILLLIGFVPLIARIVTCWVRDEEAPGTRHRLTYISRGLVDVGELNLPEAENATRSLARLTLDMHQSAFSILSDPSSDSAAVALRLQSMEEESDAMMHDITEYLVRCSTAELSDTNAAELTAMMRLVAEMEEICDCEYRVGKLLERARLKERTFTEEAVSGLSEHFQAVREFIVFYSDRLLTPISRADLNQAVAMEKNIDTLRRHLNKQALERMKGDSQIQTEMLYVDINNQLEKIGNHALNIIETSRSAYRTV